MPDLRILIEDEAHVVVSWKNVVVESIRGAPTLAGQHAMTKVLRDHVKAHPEGIGHMLLIPVRTPVPQAEVREAITQMMREFSADEILGMGIVLSGSGFWAGAARGAAAGMFMAARVRFPVKIYKTLGDATQWLEPLAGRSSGKADWTTLEIQSVVDPIKPPGQDDA